MKRVVVWVAWVAGGLGGVDRLRASVIAADGFESYAAGSQLGGQNGGTGFTNPYVVPTAASPNVTVANQSLGYSGGIVSSDGGGKSARVTGVADAVNLIARSIPAQTGTPVYFSFLYNTGTTTEAFLQFGLESGAAGEPSASIGLQGINGNGTGAEGFFVRVPNGGASTFAGSGIAANTTYFLVGRVSKGTGSTTYNLVDLFVNPTNLNESSPTLSVSNTAGTGVGTFDNFVLRTARTDAASQYNFDNLTIGTTYSDVVPTPEPSCLAMVATGGLLLLRRRRRTTSVT